MRRFTSIYIHTAHFGHNTEITLQDVPNRAYTLRLFVENVEREVQRKDDHTWTPAQRQEWIYGSFLWALWHAWMKMAHEPLSPFPFHSLSASLLAQFAVSPG